ncbi:MAG: bifunctional diguanylate cyclase/phosphodiesterase, partial [Clostridiales bacterium]|nr:bifunctional diguanylate cyclase/phosphodiesterase [Clostridiales bacterium]
MSNVPVVFSVVFSIACGISLFLGIYILYMNPKSNTNRLFFVLCISLAVWAMGFSIAISTHSLSNCLFWRKFSALGWGTFFSFLLHFFLEYTGKTKLLKKKWIYFILYIPSILTLVGFTYVPGINPQKLNMVNTSSGWINVAVNNAWDIFYIIYYVSFSAVSFLLMWQ